MTRIVSPSHHHRAPLTVSDGAPGTIEIRIVLKRLPEASAAAEAAFTAYNFPPTLFVRAERLVKLNVGGGGITLVPVT